MLKFSPNITIYGLKHKPERLLETIWIHAKYLKGVATVRQRVNIHLVESVRAEGHNLEGSIKSIWKYAEPPVSTASKKEIHYFVLTLITEALLSIADELGWNKENITEAYEKSIITESFEYLSRFYFNKSRKLKAQLKVILDGDKVSIYALMYDKKETLLQEVKMLDTFSFHIDWLSTFKKAKWLDEYCFGFEFSEKISLSCTEGKTSASWKCRKTAKNRGFIRSVTYRKLSSEEDIVEWMSG